MLWFEPASIVRIAPQGASILVINRRELLVGSASALVVGGLGTARRASAQMFSVSREFSRALFLARLNDGFFLWDASTWTVVDLELVSLDDVDGSRELEQFSLLFRDGSGSELDGGTYLLANAETGFFQIHLEPAGLDDRGASYYSADFSLLLRRGVAPRG